MSTGLCICIYISKMYKKVRRKRLFSDTLTIQVAYNSSDDDAQLESIVNGDTISRIVQLRKQKESGLGISIKVFGFQIICVK